MKKFLVGIAIAMASMMPFQASAGLALCNIVAGTACLADTGDELFSAIDTDGTTDTITNFVFSRSASLGNTISFYDPDNLGSVLDIFTAADSAFTARTVFWDNGTNILSTDTGSIAIAGGEFGIMNLTTGGNTWYSQNLLNSDGFDHLLVFDTLGNTPGAGFLNAMNYTFAWEDLPYGGDKDWNDVIHACTDCTPSGPTTHQVPVSGTMALLPVGLAGLVFTRKRKLNS